MTIWLPIVFAAGVAAVVLIRAQVQQHRPIVLLAAGPAPFVHVGADEHWRPALEVAAVTAAVAGHTVPDLAELTLLADFDALIDAWRTDPPWLTEWRDVVDAAYATAGADTSVHHRWRGGALEVTTAEYHLVVSAPAGAR